jgi:hypothetical protein
LKRIKSLCLLAALLLIGAAVGIHVNMSHMGVQGGTPAISQADEISWNGTDLNETIAISSQPPSYDATVTPRIVVEYGESLTSQAITPINESFQIDPRIMMEYAEYSNYAFANLQRYPGQAPIGLVIETPVEEPSGEVPTETSKMVSFNVSSELSPPKNITFSYRTTLNQTWNSMILTYPQDGNLTVAVNVTIPGQSEPCNVTYMIEAYNYREDYALNDKAGEYYTYPVTPEFQPAILLLIVIGLTALATTVYRKKLHSRN